VFHVEQFCTALRTHSAPHSDGRHARSVQMRAKVFHVEQAASA